MIEIITADIFASLCEKWWHTYNINVCVLFILF